MAPGQESNKFGYNHYLIFLCDHQLMYIKWKVCKEACHTVIMRVCLCKYNVGVNAWRGKLIKRVYMYIVIHQYCNCIYAIDPCIFLHNTSVQSTQEAFSKPKWMIMFRNIAWSQPSSRWYRTPPYCGVLQIEIIQ